MNSFKSVSYNRFVVATLMCLQLGLVVSNGLLIKWLSRNGVSSFGIVLFRGCGCATTTLIVAAALKEKVWPKRPKVQAIRLLLAGSALTALTFSYQYLDVSSATLISKLDIPILLITGAWLGLSVNGAQRVMAIFGFLTFLGVLFVSRSVQQLFPGIVFGLGGALMIAIGYVFLRNSFNSESISTTLLTPSVACIVFGGLGLLFHRDALAIPLNLSPYLVVSGLLMYALYRVSGLLYGHLSIVAAECPSMMAPIVAMPFEKLLFSTVYPWTYPMGIVCTVIFVMFALILGNRNYGN